MPPSIARLTCRSVLAFALALMPLDAYAFSRIKDLADIEGVRENMLIGYGLVAGLNGTGDTLQNSPFTRQALQTLLERLGVNTRGANVNTKDIAAVMVTASLPPFAAPGSKVDVTDSAMGDSKSLQGGTLLATPLLAADGEVYALAQGPLARRRLLGGRRGRIGYARRADLGPHLEWRHSRARSQLQAHGSTVLEAVPAQP